MKNSNAASLFLKHVISVLSSMAKAKTMSIRSKADDMKARFTVYSLLKNRKLSLGAIRHKINAILGNKNQENEQDQNKEAIAKTTNGLASSITHDHHHEKDSQKYEYEEEDDDKYPNLRHSLFDEDDLDLGDPNASAIDLVKNSKEDSENFNLEDEIDQVADLFILKFHKKMRLQKLESFKRYQEMLEST